MAVIYQASQTTTWATASSVTITKPTGLQEGDLMIAQIAWQYDGGNVTITPLSTWRDLDGTLNQVTQQGSGVGGGLAQAVQYRIADANDVAATNFTWNISSSVTEIGGAIMVVRGQALTTPIPDWGAATVVDSNTPSFANTVTPTVANSLLVMLGTVSE